MISPYTKNEKMTNLKCGTRVKLNHPPHLEGVEGKIIGMSGSHQSAIGATYIIKPDDGSKIYSKEYPYEVFSAFECMFDVIAIS